MHSCVTYVNLKIVRKHVSIPAAPAPPKGAFGPAAASTAKVSGTHGPQHLQRKTGILTRTEPGEVEHFVLRRLRQPPPQKYVLLYAKTPKKINYIYTYIVLLEKKQCCENSDRKKTHQWLRLGCDRKKHWKQSFLGKEQRWQMLFHQAS